MVIGIVGLYFRSAGQRDRPVRGQEIIESSVGSDGAYSAEPELHDYDGMPTAARISALRSFGGQSAPKFGLGVCVHEPADRGQSRGSPRSRSATSDCRICVLPPAIEMARVVRNSRMTGPSRRPASPASSS